MSVAPAEPVELEDYLQLASALLAAVIFLVALLSWRRRPHRRTLLLTAAFGLFLLRSAFLVASDFLVAQAAGDALERAAVVLEAAFLVLLAAAFLKG